MATLHLTTLAFAFPSIAPESIVFALTTLIAIFSAFNVLSQRNPVYSALFLVANFFCLAIYYLLLSAQFLAAVQIIVYAGAIMVLFLFVITLLSPGREEVGDDRLRTIQAPTVVLGVVLGAVLAGVLMLNPVLGTNNPTITPDPTQANPPALAPSSLSLPDSPTMAKALDKTGQNELNMGTVQQVGIQLYRYFLFPFEVTSLLLLVAMLGAIILAKRRVT